MKALIIFGPIFTLAIDPTEIPESLLEEPETTEFAYTGSTWSPYKCGDCGCCCRPEHRGSCRTVRLYDEWDCKHGDFQIWGNAELKLHDWAKSKVVATFSVEECRSRCVQESDWCAAFAYQGGLFKCTLSEDFDGSPAENPEKYEPATIGMLCSHTPSSTEYLPDPQMYLDNNCESQYVKAIKSGDAILPVCDTYGNYKAKQCGVTTGWQMINDTIPEEECHCVDQYGAIRNKLEPWIKIKNTCETSLAHEELERLTNDIHVAIGAKLQKFTSYQKIAEKLEIPFNMIFSNINKAVHECGENPEEAIEIMTRPDMPNTCDDFETIFSQIHRFNEMYTGKWKNCKNAHAKSVKRLRNQLNRLKSKILKKLDC